MNKVAVTVVVDKDTIICSTTNVGNKADSSNDLIHSVVFEQQYELVGCRENY